MGQDVKHLDVRTEVDREDVKTVAGTNERGRYSVTRNSSDAGTRFKCLPSVHLVHGSSQAHQASKVLVYRRIHQMLPISTTSRQGESSRHDRQHKARIDNLGPSAIQSTVLTSPGDFSVNATRNINT